MSSNRDEVLRLRFEWANQDVKKLKKDYADLEKAQVDLEAGLDDAAKSAVKMQIELNKIGQQKGLKALAQTAAELAYVTDGNRTAIEWLSRSVAELGGTDKDLQRLTHEYTKQIQLIAQAEKRTDALAAKERERAARANAPRSADDVFGDVSRRVGLFGDVESNLNAIRGAAGAAGIDIKGLEIAAELGAVTEAAPRLITAVKGIPEQFGNVVDVIGKGGVGLIGATAALIAVYKLANDEFNRQRQTASTVLDTQREINDLVRTSSADELEIEKRKREENLQSALEEQQKLKDLRAAFVRDLDAAGLGGAARLASDLGISAGELTSTEESLRKVEQEVIANRTALDALANANVNGKIAALRAAEAEEKLAKARADFARYEIDFRIGLQQELLDLSRNGSKEQLDDRLAALAIEKEAILSQIQAAQKLADATGDTSQVDDLRRRLFELDSTMLTLAQTAQPLVEAREREAAAIEAQRQKTEGLIAATDQYNKDVESIESATAERRADIQKKLNDTLVDIAEKAAESAENILSKLESERDKLSQSFARGDADAVKKAQFDSLTNLIKYQQSEAKAARDHARKLADIRRQAAQDEADAADARDFARLFDIRRNTTKQLQEANSAERDRLIEARIAFNEQTEERARQFAYEREQRLQKYNQDLADAAEQARRELAANEVNRRLAIAKAQQSFSQEQQLLNQKYNNEITILRRAIEAELKIISQGATARLQIEAQVQAALIKQAQQIMSGGITGGGNKIAAPGKSIPTFGDGGMMRAGMPGFVNEKYPGQRESFNGLRLPSGAGLFIPSRSGMISDSGGSGTVVNINQTIHGGGNNPEAVGAASARMISQALREVLT